MAGLFDHVFHKADDSGFDLENPTLTDSTNAALTVLNRNPNGFVLMIENGAVDWGGHANNMDDMIGEKIDFDEAVQAVIDWVENPANGSSCTNTLVIVTGDHECGYLTAKPGVLPNVPLGDVNDTTLALEKIVSGSGGRRASWVDNGNSVIDPGETVYWAWNSGGHSNSLIPLYARGSGSALFANYATGVDTVRGAYLDNTDVFKVMDSVIGNAPPVASNDSAATTESSPVTINVINNNTDIDGIINPATVVLIRFPTNGNSVSNGDGTVTYSPDFGYTGQDTFTYKVQDDCGVNSNEATVTVTVNTATAGFTAYNDLAWAAGQLNTNVTTITSPNGGSGLQSSGELMNFDTGSGTGVTLTVTGGDFNGSSHATLHSGTPASGTDAYNVFNGKLTAFGTVSYLNLSPPAGNLVLTFGGLNPGKLYELVFYAHRNNYGWDRASLVTLSGALSFTNQSSDATGNPGEPGGAIFSGPGDSSTRLPADNDNGYVARFTEISPGSDGVVVLTISFNGTPGFEYKGLYANAVMLSEQ
ncbi:MAG: alkaline phosphatase [Candidatus Scalindua sp.]|nr:alkaline phosphatase [Candidatus Scalindua sp.]